MKWDNATNQVKEFTLQVIDEIQTVIGDNTVGFYLHGSLALGGFNPISSDIDLLVVTEKALTLHEKLTLTEFFLKWSKKPFPIEVSFMNRSQVEKWEYPSAYDYHFSEYWRKRYEEDREQWLIEENRDADLAAHITIINYKGICLRGESIELVFPNIPMIDYIDSIWEDYMDCLSNIEKKPVYCILNMLRVYRYLMDGTIFSKMDAGMWGSEFLPEKQSQLVNFAIDIYTGERSDLQFKTENLVAFKEYIKEEVNVLLTLRAGRIDEIER
ncbi:MAG: aminoglycoside adenylyltransferase domain-containing protein [Psychrobacillus sp.]